MSCPVDFGPEWDALMNAGLSPREARDAFALNGDLIPTPEKAEELLAEHRTLMADQRHVARSTQSKIDRVIDQAENQLAPFLENDQVTDSQKQAIQGLLDNSNAYRELLLDNLEKEKNGLVPIQTISVTTVLGSSDYTGPMSTYEGFKLFGTYIHQILEDLQVLSNKQRKTPSQLLTRQWFDEHRANMREKDKFQIDGMDEDAIFEMAGQVAALMQKDAKSKSIILPEITLMGTDTFNQPIVGRLDLMVIDPDGNVKVLDFKTKKVKNLVDSNGEIDPDAAQSKLARESWGISGTVLGNNAMFSGQNRTTYDTWTLQTKAYENMLRQAGLKVSGSEILCLMYQANPGAGGLGQQFAGYAVQVFSGNNYYTAAGAGAVDSRGRPLTESMTMGLVNALRDKIDILLPITKKDREESQKNLLRDYAFDLSEDGENRLFDQMQKFIKAEQEKAYRGLSAAKGRNAELETLYLARLNTLKEFKNSIGLRAKTVSSLKMRFTTEALHEEYDRLNKLVAAAQETFENSHGQEKYAAGEVIRQAYHSMIELNPMFSMVNGVITEAVNDLEIPGITASSEIVTLMADLSRTETRIVESFRKVGLFHNVENIQQMIGKTGHINMSEALRQKLEVDIAGLKRQIEGLESEARSSGGAFNSRVAKGMWFLKDKISKALITQNADDIQKSRLAKLDELQLKLAAKEAEYETGFASSPDEIRKYVEGVTNPESTYYLGQSDRWANLGTGLDGFQATIANSDQGLFAFTARLKQAANEAIQNAMADNQASNVGETIRKVVDATSEGEANKMVGETRTITRTNEKGEVRTSTQQYFIKPTHTNFDQKRFDYEDQLRIKNREIRDLEGEMGDLGKTVEEEMKYAELKLKHRAMLTAREEFSKAHDEWRAEHEHQEMVPEYYALENQLPPDIKAEISAKYYDLSMLIKKSGGAHNEEIFDETNPDSLEQIHQIGIDIRRLRAEAAALNPNYGDIIKKMDDFYKYDIDEDGYNRVLNVKIREYANNPEKMALWHQENTVTGPTKEFFNDLGLIYDQIAAIKGEMDPEMKELLDERRRIMAPYRRDGEFNSTWLTAADIQALERIQMKFENFEHKDDVLDDDQKETLKKLHSEIKAMTQKKINPYYQRKLQEDTDRLMIQWNEWQQAQADVVRAKSSGDAKTLSDAYAHEETMEIQFRKTQDKYEVWFNQNHMQKFNKTPAKGKAPIKFENTGIDPRTNIQPREFNFDKVPSDLMAARYLKERPRGNWNRRKIKDAAKNPDYEKHFRLPDGTPLPKSLRIDNGVVSVIPGTDQQYVNPEYLNMLKNPLANELYHTLIPYYFKRQQAISGKKPGYVVPGGNGNLYQEAANMREGIIGALKKRKSDFMDENFGGLESQNEKFSNEYGTSTKTRLRGNEQLAEGVQGGDHINNLIMWAAESHYNEAMAGVRPQMESMIDYWDLQLKDVNALNTGNDPVYKKRAAELTKLIQLARYELDKHVTGKVSDGSNLVARKILGKMSAATAFARISFDMANQTKNYVSGSLQSFMAAGNGKSSNYTREDSMWAYHQQFGSSGFMADYIRDYGKISGLSLKTQLYLTFDPGQHGIEKMLQDTTGSARRRAMAKVGSMEMGHALQEKGDMLICQNVWLAVMNHHEFYEMDPVTKQRVEIGIREDGTPQFKMVKAHQAYILNSDNQLVIRKDVEYTKDDERRLRQIVHSEVRKAQGNYATADKTHNESTLFGQVMSFFRKYLIPNVLTRLGHARPNWEGDELHYGYLRATFDAMKAYGLMETSKHLLLGAYTPTWIKSSKMNTLYSGKVAHAGRDIIAASVLSAVSLLLLNYVKQMDDDDEEIGFWMGNMIRVVWGVKQETVSMNPFPIVGGADDYIKNFTSFTTMTNELTKIPKALTHLLAATYWGIFGDSEQEPEEGSFLELAYKSAKYSRAQGPYEEGDFKLSKDFADFSGYKNVRNFFNPRYGIEAVQNFQ